MGYPARINKKLYNLTARCCARRVLVHWQRTVISSYLEDGVIENYLDTGDVLKRIPAYRKATRAATCVSSSMMYTYQAAKAVCHAANIHDRKSQDYAQSQAHKAAQCEGRVWMRTNAGVFSTRDDLFAYVNAKAKKHKHLFETLMSELQDLTSLRLDIAWIDPWLTREMWRALELPDLDIVCDWYEQNKNGD